MSYPSIQKFFRQIRAGVECITVSRLSCTDERPVGFSSGKQTTWMDRAEAVRAAGALLEASGAPITLLVWKDPTAELPTDDETLFLKDEDGAVWIGYYDEGVWRDADAQPLNWTVTGWTHTGGAQ